MAGELSRPEYSARYGPTTGDRIRLGDTDLLARIERDESSYGDEVLRGWAKTLRTGIMTNAELPAASADGMRRGWTRWTCVSMPPGVAMKPCP